MDVRPGQWGGGAGKKKQRPRVDGKLGPKKKVWGNDKMTDANGTMAVWSGTRMGITALPKKDL